MSRLLFSASNALPAPSKMTRSTGTPSRLASSRASSTVTPSASPFGPFCASTLLPWLIAARSRPVGANSLTSSDDTGLTGTPFLK